MDDDPRGRALLAYLYEEHGEQPLAGLRSGIEGFRRWLDKHPEYDDPIVSGWVEQQDPDRLKPEGGSSDG